MTASLPMTKARATTKPTDSPMMRPSRLSSSSPSPLESPVSCSNATQAKCMITFFATECAKQPNFESMAVSQITDCLTVVPFILATSLGHNNLFLLKNTMEYHQQI